jgi:hypothetical protein
MATERDKICVPVESLAQWAGICGDNARKDMLYGERAAPADSAQPALVARATACV